MTGVLVGLIVMADTIKPEAHATVYALQRRRMGVYLLTGDNRHTAQAIASKVAHLVITTTVVWKYFVVKNFHG